MHQQEDYKVGPEELHDTALPHPHDVQEPPEPLRRRVLFIEVL